MKKRLLSVLLLVCMVLTLLPTAALAEDMHEHEALPAAAHTHCFCGGSVNAGDHTSHKDVTYKAWNGTSGISYTNNTAYVYLTNNITLNSFLSLQLGKTLYLCLNGLVHRDDGDACNVVEAENIRQLHGNIKVVFRAADQRHPSLG